MTPGAYLLVRGTWSALPKNHGRLVQTRVQAATAKLVGAKLAEEAFAGVRTDDPPTPVADATFDGSEPVPRASADGLTLVFIGELPAPPADALARYPSLKAYPALELARLKTLPNGVRTAPLVLIAPGLIAIGPNRVPATIAQPRPGVTLLRTTAWTGPGRYVLMCGSEVYEVELW